MESKGILLDADILSHFMVSDSLELLPAIFKGHLLMVVDQVYQEASYSPGDPGRKTVLDRWIKDHSVIRLSFPSDLSSVVVDEYYRLKAQHPRLGKGERACLSIARYHQDVIASSNFRDVAAYCHVHGLEYLGMLDVLWIGVRRNVIPATEANAILARAILRNSARFPVSLLEDYQPRAGLKDWV